jgi:hypothetical protein
MIEILGVMVTDMARADVSADKGANKVLSPGTAFFRLIGGPFWKMTCCF